MELVRYIHLNPIRAKVVQNLQQLRKFPFCGYQVLMGKYDHEWQDTEYVLGMFGQTTRSARRAYAAFMAEGISAGPRPDLVGGGLVRSVGGWSALKAYRKIGIRIKGDERILGSSDFVEKTLEKANERLAEKTRIKAVGPDLDSLVEKVAVYFKIDTEDLKTASKERRISRARSILSYLAVRKMMISCAEVARALNISPSAVSKAVIKGRALIDRKQIQKQLLDF